MKKETVGSDKARLLWQVTIIAFPRHWWDEEKICTKTRTKQPTGTFINITYSYIYYSLYILKHELYIYENIMTCILLTGNMLPADKVQDFLDPNYIEQMEAILREKKLFNPLSNYIALRDYLVASLATSKVHRVRAIVEVTISIVNNVKWDNEHGKYVFSVSRFNLYIGLMLQIQ